MGGQCWPAKLAGMLLAGVVCAATPRRFVLEPQKGNGRDGQRQDHVTGERTLAQGEWDQHEQGKGAGKRWHNKRK